MLLVPATAGAAPELSVSDRLQDRREVTAGTRAYSVGFQDGRFYANGWHITGEMGGIWAPPLKLADGLWFGVDDQWVGPATKFTSGRGYTRYDLPPRSRPEPAPHRLRPGRPPRGAVRARARQPRPGAPKTVTVKVDVHSELLGAYPWGFDDVVPNAKDNLADRAAYEDGALVFTDKGTLPGGEPHDYAMLAGSDRRPAGGRDRPGPLGPAAGQAAARRPTRSPPSACDDGPFGNGTGGQLRYRVTVKPRDARDRLDRRRRLGQGPRRGAPRTRRRAARPRPPARAEGRVARGARRSARSSTCPATASCRRRSTGASRTSPTSPRPRPTCGSASSTRASSTRRRSPRCASATFVGAGYPDYPWMFATDGEYTAFASVAVGQFEAIKEHLLALRDISDALNARSGKVAHEVVTDGSVWFGANTDPGNTDESVEVPERGRARLALDGRRPLPRRAL